jgi:hypothetical protein
MASRKQITYQSEVLYVGPTPASGDHITASGDSLIKQLHRTQEFGLDTSMTRTDVNQFGQLANIGRILEDITVGMNFAYYLTDGYNEKALGLFVNNADTVTSDGNGGYRMVTPLSGFLSKATDEKNYFSLTVGEGQDAILDAGSEYTATQREEHEVFAIGNGFISNYAMEAAVGGLARATVNVEAMNMKWESNSSGQYIPAINNSGCEIQKTYFLPTARESSSALMPMALKAGDIELEYFDGNTVGGTTLSTMKVQNLSVTIPIGREGLKEIGSRFAYSREITFPITATISMSANISDITTGNLAKLYCEDPEASLLFKLYTPECNADAGCGKGSPAMSYYIKGANITSQNFANSIGARKTVDISWEVQMGGIGDYDKGVFISGADALL